jgi:peptidyl-prolyl cis-trans isomerase-like 6
MITSNQMAFFST